MKILPLRNKSSPQQICNGGVCPAKQKLPTAIQPDVPIGKSMPVPYGGWQQTDQQQQQSPHQQQQQPTIIIQNIIQQPSASYPMEPTMRYIPASYYYVDPSTCIPACYALPPCVERM